MNPGYGRWNQVWYDAKSIRNHQVLVEKTSSAVGLYCTSVLEEMVDYEVLCGYSSRR
jgi:hypothetical protein